MKAHRKYYDTNIPNHKETLDPEPYGINVLTRINVISPTISEHYIKSCESNTNISNNPQYSQSHISISPIIWKQNIQSYKSKIYNHIKAISQNTWMRYTRWYESDIPDDMKVIYSLIWKQYPQWYKNTILNNLKSNISNHMKSISPVKWTNYPQ